MNMNFLVLLLPLVIGLTWIRLVRPGFNRLQGTTTLIVPLPLLARLRMHALPALLALGLGTWFAVNGDLPWWTLAIPVISNVLLMAIPVKYTLTTDGIRLGWTAFRRWTEFAGVRRAPGGARLVGANKTLGMSIWLSGSRGDDEFLHFLRRTVRDAYKGKGDVVPFPVERTSPQNAIDADSLQDGISAFTTER
jgi:hypothetical protein